MVAQANLVQDLQSLLSGEHARTPSNEYYAVDGMLPKAEVSPGSYEDVAAVLRYANERGLAVIPRGNGTKMHVGNLPSRYDIALSVKRLSRVIEYEPADLTVTCQSGMMVENLNRHLQKPGQMTPFGPWPRDPTTIGGNLAANESLHRLALGSPRDFTIGMRVVTPDGRITKAGGKVVKNVAGYDLCKLYIGSQGTLGVIVEATFKLVPLPQQRKWIDFEFASVGEACLFANSINGLGLSVWDLDLSRLPQQGSDPVSSSIVRISLAGTIAGVERSQREIYRLAGENDVGQVNGSQRPNGDDNFPFWALRNHPLVCEARVLPSLVPTLVDALDREVPGGFLSVSPLEGNMRLVWPNSRRSDRPLVDRLRAVVKAVSGTLVVTHCDTDLKRRIDVFGDPPPAFELMRSVKQQFDPNGILSPGRFVGRL